MPVAFIPDWLHLIHPLCMLVECLDIHGITMMELLFDANLENRLTLLLDLVRDRCGDQIERNALDLLDNPLRRISSPGIGCHLTNLVR
jgi:hypothetical protein